MIFERCILSSAKKRSKWSHLASSRRRELPRFRPIFRRGENDILPTNLNTNNMSGTCCYSSPGVLHNIQGDITNLLRRRGRRNCKFTIQRFSHMPPVSPYFHPSLLHFPREFNPHPPPASATLHKTLTHPTLVHQQDAEKEERDSEREEPR